MQKKQQILVIDDEEGVRVSFHMALKDSYEVLTGDCGQACLKILEKEHPQLVILDVLLPDINGIEVLKKIKQINESLPVIVITGAGTHKIAIEALRLGAVDFIAKPLNFSYLKTAIADFLSTDNTASKGLPSAEDIITKNYLSSLKMLNKILEVRDPLTREHSKRVSDYSVKIAQEFGLSAEEQEVMRQTALLHDIGKVGVAEALLSKQGRLNPQEWVEIQKHTLIGAEILEPLKLFHIEQSMIRHHHERYDGTGYPDHLKGDEIPLYARILAVADAYDSMTQGRIYRYAYSPIEALTELERCNSSQFDPKVVKAFVKALRRDKKIFKIRKGEK